MPASKTPAIASLAVLGFADISSAQEAPKLFIEGDIVRGNTPAGITGPVCVLANQFKRKENVVFRIRVRNAAGQSLDDKNIKGITVELSDGQKFLPRFGGHPPKAPTAYIWSTAWVIPDAYPTGSFNYKVVATALDGATQTWEPINTKPTLLTIVAGTFEPPPK